MSDTIFIGIAWPYANGRLHLGHVAGTLLPADIFSRYHRLTGNDVLAVSGSDAHGTPITIAADKAGLSPKAYFEAVHQQFLESQLALGISYDLFTHTDTENHHCVARDLFRKLYENGYITPQTQTLFYSESERRFLPDRYVEGTCPHCGYTQARGDQCDACGLILDPTELINPVSTRDGTEPVVRDSEQLFFDLGAFSEQLLAYFESHQHHWRPNPLNFSRSLIEGGLRKRPFTRDLEWGISVPVEGWEEKKLYIWAENIVGYLSAAIEWAHNRGEPEAWRYWWTNPETKSYYFLGKDNIPFHTIFWPAELLGIQNLYPQSEDERLVLPYDVPANAYLTLEGEKFSTSRNHAVWLDDVLAAYGPDAVRFYLSTILPETQDANFTWAEFVQRNNSELVGAWGNLVNRVLSFAYKHWGEVPQPGEIRPFDQTLTTDLTVGFQTVANLIEAVKLRAALNECLRLARRINGYLDVAPWYQLIKTDKAAAATTVYHALWAIDCLKTLFAPFLPHSSQLLHQLLGYDGHLFGETTIETFHEANSSHDALVYDSTRATGKWVVSRLAVGQRLGRPFPLFQKLDEAVIEEEQRKLSIVNSQLPIVNEVG